MGIKDLNTFLTKFAINSIKNDSLKNFCNKKVAIDVSIFLYKYKYKSDNIIPKFLEQINRLRLNKITPIYIFDGKPPIEKQNILKQRKNNKINREQKIKNLEEQIYKIKETINKTHNSDIKDIQKTEYNSLVTELDICNKRNIIINKKDIDNLKEFFKVLKINYIQSDGEADLLCSNLSKKGIVDMVISEDMDILTSSTPLLLRNFNYNSNNVTVYNLKTILKELDLDYDSWVKLCILFGCDYLKRIPYIGPSYSYNILKNINLDSNRIENIVDYIQKNKGTCIPENYIDNFKKAYTIFTEDSYIKYNDLSIDTNIQLESIEKENLIKFLQNNTELSLKKINNRIKNIYY